MNQEQLLRMHSRKGFIAALDQSGGSTPKALTIYGVPTNSYNNEEEMFNIVHEMRTRIITSPSFTSEHILGAILFENTMDKTIDKEYTADYLWKTEGIVPFLKVDKGLHEEEDGVQLMKDIPDLDELLERAKARNIFGTKMRSVIKSANRNGIRKLVAEQFYIALKIASKDLLPIIEPEVDINSTDKAESEKILLEEIFEMLDEVSLNTKLMFKVSIPSSPGFYSKLMKDPRVVRVVALSGGYSKNEANEKLKDNPGLIASFSRALSEGLRYDQTQVEFDTMLNNSIEEIYEASIS